MASIERTASPRFKPSLTTDEPHALYSFTFVMQRFVGPANPLPCCMTAYHLLCVAKRHPTGIAYYLSYQE
jgi:hypothetical protein